MKRRAPREHHAGHDRWLVSYADFITLLFAFFVVLYASAEMDRRKIVQISAAIASGFQQMGALPGGPAAAGQREPTMASGVTPSSSRAGLPPQPDAGPGGVMDAEALRRELENVLGREIREHEIEMRVTPEGLVLSLREVGFFESAHASVLPGGIPKLGKIAQVLSVHGFEIRVEGHTDDVPIHNADFRSNWELSTARATHVVTLLVENYKLDPLRVSAAGYGPYRPVASNATPEGRRVNRRVDLVITSRGNPAAAVSADAAPTTSARSDAVDRAAPLPDGRSERAN